ncbi:MAG: hypothetical protein IJP27_03445 [Clostridia bacterium]|nr:hypothetical protein [Clostridia bacterium]
MKRFLSIALILMMVLSLAACGTKEAAKDVKLGLGVVAAYGNSTNAEGETNGKTAVTVTTAAVLVDADGKIVACAIDELAPDLSYTAEGKGVAVADLRTKLELGTDYGMAAYGQSQDKNGDGVVKEWNEQVAALVAAIKGKTIDEVKGLVVNGYGTEDVQTAGCTIAISGLIAAVEKAVANAAESAAKADATLQLGVVAKQTVSDFTEEKEGSNKLEVSVTAAALADGKVTAAATDAVDATVSFDAKGVVTSDVKAALTSKKELGTNYGMAAYGQSQDKNGDGVVKEWNEQAAAFDAALIGKNATEIAALENAGYGVESLQTAGCTIAISNMVQAAVKAATV